MLSFIKYLLLIFIPLSSLFAKELEGSSLQHWKRILFYEEGESKAYQDSFFVSKNGRNDALSEYKASIEAIVKRKKVGRKSDIFPCSFPARYQFILKNHPELKFKYKCNDLDEWKNAIRAKEIFVVYASSYVTNPASVFGHSFLRLSRGGSDPSSALLDYSTGFLAVTDSNDNSLVYAYKGMTGQYLGGFEIKPFYMNVGLYQNSEDRDLWQYKLPLKQKEVDFFINLLWELSIHTGFKYYFFDENCSSYILKALEAVRPSWNFLNRSYLFAHPIETLKWMEEEIEEMPNQYLAGINKNLRYRLSKMTNSERELFLKAKKNENAIAKISSVKVLDALLDHWKFENYKEGGNLSIKKKRLMNKTILKRASIDQISKDENIGFDKYQSPLKFHDPNSLALSLRESHSNFTGELEYKLGYQNLDDPSLGHDDYSFIDYLGFKLGFDEKLKLDEVLIVEIWSLTPFVYELPKFSWNLALKYNREDEFFDEDSLNLSLGFGLTKQINRQSVFASIGPKFYFGKDRSEIRPEIKVGKRLIYREFVWASVLYLENNEEISSRIESKLNYQLSKSLSLGISIENINTGEESRFINGIHVKSFF